MRQMECLRRACRAGGPEQRCRCVPGWRRRVFTVGPQQGPPTQRCTSVLAGGVEQEDRDVAGLHRCLNRSQVAMGGKGQAGTAQLHRRPELRRIGKVVHGHQYATRSQHRQGHGNPFRAVLRPERNRGATRRARGPETTGQCGRVGCERPAFPGSTAVLRRDHHGWMLVTRCEDAQQTADAPSLRQDAAPSDAPSSSIRAAIGRRRRLTTLILPIRCAVRSSPSTKVRTIDGAMAPWRSSSARRRSGNSAPMRARSIRIGNHEAKVNPLGVVLGRVFPCTPQSAQRRE